MLNRTLVKLAAGASLTLSLSVQAEITPYIFAAVVSEGTGDRTTWGSYSEDLGRYLGMFFPVDFDTTNASATSSPAAGTTVYDFLGEESHSLAMVYGAEFEGSVIGFEADHFRLTYVDDVDLSGVVAGGTELSGIYDKLDLSFDTYESRGEGVKTTHSVSLIGADNWLQGAGPGSVFGADFIIAQWQDESLVSGEVLGFANLEIIGLEMLGPYPQVPIPAASWLFGAALLGLATVGRRRIG